MEPRLLGAGGSDAKGPEGRERAKAKIIQRAILYQEAEAHPGIRDWIAHVTRWKTQLEGDLRWGHLRRDRAFGTTDDEIRAMLYVLGLVLDVPAQAHAAYDRVRQQDDEAARIMARVEARFGAGSEAE